MKKPKAKQLGKIDDSPIKVDLTKKEEDAVQESKPEGSMLEPVDESKEAGQEAQVELQSVGEENKEEAPIIQEITEEEVEAEVEAEVEEVAEEEPVLEELLEEFEDGDAPPEEAPEDPPRRRGAPGPEPRRRAPQPAFPEMGIEVPDLDADQVFALLEAAGAVPSLEGRVDRVEEP